MLVCMSSFLIQELCFSIADSSLRLSWRENTTVSAEEDIVSYLNEDFCVETFFAVPS